MTELLNDGELTDGLASCRGGGATATRSASQFQAADFVAAMAFVDEVALRAEAAGHHPDIDIRWNKVSFALSTHSAGGLTRQGSGAGERRSRQLPRMRR